MRLPPALPLNTSIECKLCNVPIWNVIPQKTDHLYSPSTQAIVYFLIIPGCREHTHAGRCFQMHSGHSYQLHRTAGVPGVARDHSGMPERTHFTKWTLVYIQKQNRTITASQRIECPWAGQNILYFICHICCIDEEQEMRSVKVWLRSHAGFQPGM